MNAALRQIALAIRAERTKQAHLRALREECTALGLNEAARLRLQVSLTEEEPSLHALEALINDALTRRRVETRRHGKAA